MDIDKTLTKGYNASGRGSQISVIVGDKQHTRCNGYFFLKSELVLKTYANEKQMIRECKIRHMIINSKGYYDYIAKKQFTKFQDWVDSCGISDKGNILYGRNDVAKTTYNWNLNLYDLLGQIGPVLSGENPTQEEKMVNIPLKTLQDLKRIIDELCNSYEDSLTAALSRLNICVEDLYVVQDSQIVNLKELMTD